MLDTRTFGEKLNSRKLALTAGIIISATALLVYKHLTGDNWVDVVTVTSATYMATNVWQSRSKESG